jgi:transcriptional regulator with XRE-family HTH domain
MGIGERIAKFRSEQGISQTVLARSVGTSQSAISLIEAGDRNPSFDMIQRIAEALGVPAAHLVGEPLAGLTAEEEAHFRRYRGLSDQSREELELFLRYLQAREPKVPTEPG